MTDREALKLALETLEEIADEVFSPYDNKLGGAILAIRKVLAQPEQEPFGYFRYDMRLDAWVMNREGQRPGTPFYTTPPKREWVGMTEAERVDIIDIEIGAPETEHFALAQSIEAALKEKNT